MRILSKNPLQLLLALSLLAGCQTVTRTPVTGGWITSIEYRGVPENPLLTQRVIRTANEYYPKIAAVLGDPVESLTPFKIVFVKSKSLKSREWEHFGDPLGGARVGPHTQVIYLDSPWLDENPAYIDFILIHEMTHVVQRYKWRSVPRHWVEGIANYVPCKMGFGQGDFSPRSTSGYSHYLSGYHSAASLLLYLDERYGAEVIRALHRSLRKNDYTDAFFPSATGRSLEELWADYRGTPAYTESAELVDRLHRELGLKGTESRRVKAARMERYIDRQYDRAKAAEVRMEIGYRDGKPPAGAIARFSEFLFRQSLERQMTKSLQHHLEERFKNRALPWLNEREFRQARKLGRMPWADQRGPKSPVYFGGRVYPPRDFGRKFPVSLILTATNSGQALFYHYEFTLSAPRAQWRLKRAWIAEPDGRVVEERIIDR